MQMKFYLVQDACQCLDTVGFRPSPGSTLAA